MHSICIQAVIVLCGFLTACVPGQSAQTTAAASDDAFRRELVKCRTTDRDAQGNSRCARAITRRDKAAWSSKGRGIQIKPEDRR